MEKQLHQPLWTAAATTFEHLGFLFAEPEEEGGADEGTWWTHAPGSAVFFHGPVEGHLALWVSPEVAADVATTMLALEGEVSPELVRDTLGELSNVICGNILPALVSPEAEFALEAPVSWEADRASDGEPLADVRLEVGLGRARVCLFLDARQEAAAS